MESRWRRNRYLVGWNEGPFELIARYATPGLEHVFVAVIVTEDVRDVFEGIEGTSGYVDAWQYANTFDGRGFPYFYDVETDTPP